MMVVLVSSLAEPGESQGTAPSGVNNITSTVEKEM
jgi:hypothetical protein